MIDKIWKFVENVVCFFIYKVFRLDLGEKTYLSLIQFIKFGMVGVLNNVISYVIYLIMMRIGMHYTLASIIGFTVSVFNSYYWNNKYVFVSDGTRIWWQAFFKTYISYAGTGIVLNNILLIFWIEICGISVVIAPLINLFITIPINFLVNKFWAYRK